jgi:hypothetical protein
MKESHHLVRQANSKNDNNTSLARKRETDRYELVHIIRNKNSLISIDGLLDGITALVLDCEPLRKNKNIDNFLCRCKFKLSPNKTKSLFSECFILSDTPQHNLICEKRINVEDFNIIKTIGRGAFGKVQLVK